MPRKRQSMFWIKEWGSFLLLHSVITIVCLLSSITNAVITYKVQPKSLNTSLNSNVTFTCEVSGVSAIYFLVGKIPAAEDIFVDRGFTELPQCTINGTIRRRTLSVYAQEINNNTNIACSTVPYSVSNYSTLMIQGLLASVGNLNYTYINGSSVNISWTAPYTLDNVPITGYNIDDNSDNLFNTTELSYILAPANLDVCDVTNVTVAAVNCAGRGQTNNTYFYYTRVPPITPNVSVIPVINEAQVSLSISINVSTLCIGEYPNNISINILNISDTVIYSTSILSPQVNDQLITGNTSITLSDIINTFIITVSLSNNGGDFHNISYFVFGIIGPVTDIRSVIDNCTSISIYWDSPTLDDDRLSILYYNLSIHDSVNNQLVKNVPVYDTSYQFEDEDLFIHRYTYVITGVNELGEGISNNKTFSYQRIPRSAENPSIQLLNNKHNNLTVMFNVSVVLQCTGEAPKDAIIIIQCNETGVVFNKIYQVENASKPMYIARSVLVPRHENCSFIVIFSNDIGSSEPLILILNETFPEPSSTKVPAPTHKTGNVHPIVLSLAIVLLILIGIVTIIIGILLFYKKNQIKKLCKPRQGQQETEMSSM